MDYEELNAAYVTIKRRYESMAETFESMQKEIDMLKDHNAILNAQKIQWESAKGTQNDVITRALADANAARQKQAQELQDIKDKLRAKDE